MERKLKQKIKNFKLKFSRMMTCYGTINSIIGNEEIASPDDILNLSKIPPLERLRRVVETHRETISDFRIVEREYSWFLEQTNVSEDQLLETFRKKRYREEAFPKAEEFGDAMFRITHAVAEKSGYTRYLLI